MQKSDKAHCAICGEYRKMTFEHTPPEKAFNNKAVFLQNHEHHSDTQSKLYGKRIRSNRGAGGFTLCEQCNKETGGWYGNSYKEFAFQGMKQLTQNKGIPFSVGSYRIQPLNVLKQMISIFLSLDKSGSIRSDGDVQRFVKDKEHSLLPDKFKIYLYLNNSAKHRLLGYSIVADGRYSKICKWSEFSFRPFGIMLTEDSPPANRFQLDVTFFKNYAFDQVEYLRLPLFYLEVADVNFGTYKNLK